MPFKVRDEAPLEAASEMLGCNKHHLRNALLTRSLAAGREGGTPFVSAGGSRRTRGCVETLTVPLNKAQASRATDKLAREVCARPFVRGSDTALAAPTTGRRRTLQPAVKIEAEGGQEN